MIGDELLVVSVHGEDFFETFIETAFEMLEDGFVGAGVLEDEALVERIELFVQCDGETKVVGDFLDEHDGSDVLWEKFVEELMFDETIFAAKTVGEIDVPGLILLDAVSNSLLFCGLLQGVEMPITFLSFHSCPALAVRL